MTFNLLKKSIDTKNAQLVSKTLTKKEYNAWKKDILTKMDTFLMCDRITDEQYRSLEGMLQ